ncbi:hypothetical protein JVT61DRAFT_2716 [Boletus reticuloceps]|uniref:TERF2-interacting telomeric protein 1 Myb domain-containing protein n=1 Tax=Boletus reticuloceps TaxID=495285 RepID=A0A8I3A8K3_9AGAM|nr:hypothetical protein JVT61DRAFT_2716 [Boletus reticuloceps]
MPHPTKSIRVEFTGAHDNYLFKYIAKYCPTKAGRSGHKIYRQLVDNQTEWPWARHHTWQSWRERYVKNSDYFDARIRHYQRKHDIESVDKQKRPAAPLPIEMLGPSAKRAKLKKEKEVEEEKRPPSSEIHAAKSTSKSLSEHHREPREEMPPDANPPREPEPGNARHTTPVASPPRSNASASVSATKKRTLDPTPPQTRHDILEISSSSPDRQAPHLFNGNAEPRSPPRHVKRTKVRLRTPSDMFASEPSSPKMDAVAAPAVSVEAPSSEVQPAPPAPTTVLVDREGHVPRAFPRGEKEEAEEEEEEEEEVEMKEKVEWPPARGSTTIQRSTSGPNVEVGAHHAFSQLQPQLEALRGHVSPKQPDRRAVVAQFSDQVRQDVGETERREDVVRNGASPIKHIVTTAPPSDPFSGLIPKPFSNIFKFPAPRASTRSPFRPEPPIEETRRPLSPTKAARHPALNRIRRQTIGHGHYGNRNKNRKERERRRESGREVPSLDLVALSHSSTSARSHSHSSTDTSVPGRPPRWSLPVLPHAAPWVFGEPDRWAAPSPMYGDLLGHGRAGTSSTPRFMLTPSPARSITGATASASHANGMSASSSVLLTPHPPDLPLTASHGLASILAHMSTNHGLAMSVVEAVYKRVGSLREADEVLKGMREAAEGYGEREIKRRVKERRGRGEGGKGTRGNWNGRTPLTYVVASEDGEESEYSPPETSRAAMWKRQSGEVSYEEDEEVDAEEGRAVEEELRERDEDEDDAHHDFSQQAALVETNEEPDQDRQEERPKDDACEEQRVTAALLGDTRAAQELERKLGKGQYRRDIARLFV